MINIFIFRLQLLCGGQLVVKFCHLCVYVCVCMTTRPPATQSSIRVIPCGPDGEPLQQVIHIARSHTPLSVVRFVT